MITTPTVGRKLWYRPSAQDTQTMVTSNGDFATCQPLDATVVCVHGDRLVNLSVRDANGNSFARLSVTLRQEDDPVPQGAYAEWMPYQLKQAVKHAVQDASQAPIVVDVPETPHV